MVTVCNGVYMSRETHHTCLICIQCCVWVTLIFMGGARLCVYNHLTLFVASDSEMTELSSVCGCFSGVSEADTHSQSHVKLI